MQRREFSKTALAATAVAVTGAGCGGGADSPAVTMADSAAAPQRALSAPLRAPSSIAIGVNLSGLEWAETGLRFGGGSQPNIHFTPPRRADVAYLAATGYTKLRLVIKWEMLQPMLFDTVANAAARAAIGEPGGLDQTYGMYILGILDEAAARGVKVILDLHNYCRYRDFVYQPDGSVIGLVSPSNRLIRAYTTDNAQVRTRICSTAPGATLTPAHLNHFWSTVAPYLRGHPGFGGYGLMNEPYFMPRPGETVEAYQGFGQDLTIWPTFAQSAIDAIRAVDPTNPIYLGGNNWSAAMTIGDDNPGWPLRGANIIYEVHAYLDAYSNGQNYDYDTEVAKNFTAGIGNQPISANTGVDRLRIAVRWATANNVKLALTETGMAIDDARWQEAYQRMMDYAQQSGVEVFDWHGGSHWTLHNASINHVPGWYQNKTLEPISSGPMRAAAGAAGGTLFDAGPGYTASGSPVLITVFARGALETPATLTVSSSNGGTFSKTSLTIPAGANGQDTFTFTPAANTVATLNYTVTSGGLAAPPARKVYSLTDPVAYASTSLADAAMAIIAKYSACKWDLSDGYTDYLQGAPAGDGQIVRAIADSGYGSGVGNAMEMLNWTNVDNSLMGSMRPPVMRVVGGSMKISDHTAPETYGFWCRKALVIAGSQPNPRNRAPYNLADPHFMIATVGIPNASSTGVMFQASNATASTGVDLYFSNGVPQARWVDAGAQTVTVSGTAALAPLTAAVVTLTSAVGAQQLRVNRSVVGTAAASFSSSQLDQILLGWGFRNYYPEVGFGGYIKAAVTGRGAPTTAEIVVLERYLGSLAGMA